MRAVNLFCGGGGFATGALRAGVKVEAAFDVDEVLTSAHDANFPDVELHLVDVATLTGSRVMGLVEGDIEIVFGGPPCQGFSNIGLRELLFRTLFDGGFPRLFRAVDAQISHIILALPDRGTAFDDVFSARLMKARGDRFARLVGM